MLVGSTNTLSLSSLSHHNDQASEKTHSDIISDKPLGRYELLILKDGSFDMCIYIRPQKIRLPPQEKVLKEHTYTAMTPQASPSIARNPKLKPKQGKVTLPHLKGDISGMVMFS